jgi:predicted dehydrogenase
MRLWAGVEQLLSSVGRWSETFGHDQSSTGANGAVFTVDVEAGVQPERARFSFDVSGSEGWLSLTSTHPYGVQAGDLTLTSNVEFAPPEEAVASGGFMGATINVGEHYAHLVRDMHAGAHTTPGFGHGVHNARLIDAVRRAPERGSTNI